VTPNPNPGEPATGSVAAAKASAMSSTSACATIRQISGTQQQINVRSLFLNQIDDGLQRVVGIHAQ
jgi:hypothetical protein